MREALLARFLDGTHDVGERISSENEICEEFGVSRTTARQAVMRLVGDGFLTRQAGSGTYIKSRSRGESAAQRQSTGAIGFVRCQHSVSSHSLEGDYVYVEVMRGIHDEIDVCDRNLLSLYLMESDPGIGRKLDNLAGKVDGLIVTELRTQELYELLEQKGLPFVLVNPNIYSYNCDAIDTDNFGGVARGLEYLHSLGHSEIGFIKGRMPMRHALERLQAYRHTMERFGLPCDESYTAGGGNWQFETGYASARSLLESKPGLSAIFASSDPLAMGAMKAAADLGRHVPQTLCIIGFDDLIIARHATPSLTTIRVPRVEMGRYAAMTLLDRLENPLHIKRKVMLMTSLVERESCATAPRP